MIFHETCQSKKEFSCAARRTIFGHDGERDAPRDEDEQGLENMSHDLALLNIRLRNPHLSYWVTQADDRPVASTRNRNR
jgi:hypothetical protein